jgi:hypothetical protein
MSDCGEDIVNQMVMPFKLARREIKLCPMVDWELSAPIASEVKSWDASGSVNVTQPERLAAINAKRMINA